MRFIVVIFILFLFILFVSLYYKNNVSQEPFTHHIRPYAREVRRKCEHYENQYGPNAITREIKKWMIFG